MCENRHWVLVALDRTCTVCFSENKLKGQTAKQKAIDMTFIHCRQTSQVRTHLPKPTKTQPHSSNVTFHFCVHVWGNGVSSAWKYFLECIHEESHETSLLNKQMLNGLSSLGTQTRLANAFSHYIS